MTEFLLLLHILLFMFSFALTAGIAFLTNRVARGGDAKTIYAVFSAARPLSMAGGIGWLLTAATGGALAAIYSFDMTAPWLLGSYAAFAVLIIVGFAMHAPWQAKVIAASASAGPELQTVLNAPAHRIANLLSAASVLCLLYLMTARPG
ncbi:MAG TPA: DUF2269 family protein [Rhizomicrobium sp.]|nr:DUF2269 family protein [Rhizomicrobium sp.]